jgi:hypothetical protein
MDNASATNQPRAAPVYDPQTQGGHYGAIALQTMLQRLPAHDFVLGFEVFTLTLFL